MPEQRPSRAGWRLLCGALSQQRRALIRLVGWSFVVTLPALLSGRLVAFAVDRGFLAGRPEVGLSWLGLLGVTMALGAIGSRQVFPWLGFLVEPLRDMLMRTVVTSTLHRSVEGIDRPDATAVARLTSQIETVRDLVGGLLVVLLQFVLTLLAVILGILSLEPVIALLVAPPSVLALVVFGGLFLTLIPQQRALVLADEKLAESAGTVISSIRDVVACGAEERAAADVGADIEQQARAVRALARATAMRTVVIAIGGYLPLVMILLVTPRLTDHGELTTGAILGAITYVTTNLEPALRSLVRAVGSSGLRLAVVLRCLAEACALPIARDRSQARMPQGYDLELREITFAYGPHSKPIVCDFSIILRHGEHLAIVGPSGIGKSTLANLMTGSTTPQQGEIQIGGVALEAIGEDHLHRIIALIPQEAYVFTGTLRENLVYLRPEAASTDLDSAVRALGLGPLIDRLHGYDAKVGVGAAALSAGERQLIALTRVYLSDAQIIVLDEATCHLDPVAEARAEQAFAQRHGTLIVIAHRISSALRADRILLMDGARPLLGTHEQLLASSSLYGDLMGNWGGTFTSLHGQTTGPRAPNRSTSPPKPSAAVS
jgi:ABC-type multidrug transport system fused ATPase/permease subunit